MADDPQSGRRRVPRAPRLDSDDDVVEDVPAESGTKAAPAPKKAAPPKMVTKAPAKAAAPIAPVEPDPEPEAPDEPKPAAKKAASKTTAPAKKTPARRPRPQPSARHAGSIQLGGFTTLPSGLRGPPAGDIAEPPPPNEPADGTLVDASPERSGIPRRFGGTGFWFLSGLTAQPFAVGVALLAAWTGLIVSMWAAALGLILGILVAVGFLAVNSFTRSLFNAGAGQALSIVGVVTGALAGAGGTFVAVYSHELFGRPTNVLVSLGSGAALAVAIVAAISRYEGDILKLRRYRRMSNGETRRIAPLMQQVAAEMKLPDIPRFAMADLHVVGAWTYMRHVVLTPDLLETLDDRELAAVLAHELHHWAHGDSVASHFIWACAWPLAALYNLAAYCSGVQVGVTTHGLTVGRKIIPFLAWMVAWPSWLLIRFVVAPAAASGMRRSEYAADEAVVKIGRAPDLAAALRKLGAFEPARTGWEAALYGTHPPLPLRLERLEPVSQDDDDYQEGDLGVIDVEKGRRLGVAVLACIAGLLLWGAAINNHRTNPAASGTTSFNGGPGPTVTTLPNTPIAAGTAEATVAQFVSAYFDSLPTNGHRDVVAQYADPSEVTALQSTADANVQNFGGQVTASSATAVGCAYSSTDQAVAVRIKWAYTDSTGVARTEWFTDSILVNKPGSSWKVGAIPTFPDPGAPDITDSQLPSGFGSCSGH